MFREPSRHVLATEPLFLLSLLPRTFLVTHLAVALFNPGLYCLAPWRLSRHLSAHSLTVSLFFKYLPVLMRVHSLIVVFPTRAQMKQRQEGWGVTSLYSQHPAPCWVHSSYSVIWENGRDKGEQTGCRGHSCVERPGANTQPDTVGLPETSILAPWGREKGRH